MKIRYFTLEEKKKKKEQILILQSIAITFKFVQEFINITNEFHFNGRGKKNLRFIEVRRVLFKMLFTLHRMQKCSVLSRSYRIGTPCMLFMSNFVY